MPIEVNDLIKEYFEQPVIGDNGNLITLGEKYGITLEECKVICKAPFIFFRKMLESPELPIINVKFFGKFLIFPGSAKKIIDSLKVKLSKGLITEEQFHDSSVNLKCHIDDYEAETPVSTDRQETPD